MGHIDINVVKFRRSDKREHKLSPLFIFLIARDIASENKCESFYLLVSVS